MKLLKMPWNLFGKVHIQLEQTNKSEGTLQRPNFSYRGFHSNFIAEVPLGRGDKRSS